MSLTAIPTEIVLCLVDVLPTSDLSRLSRTSTTYSHLLTPLLYRRARRRHFDRCIIRDRPASLNALLGPPNTFSIHDDLLLNTPPWPLHFAAQNCSPALVATIIALGVPIDDATATPTRTTTLQHAVYGRNTDTVTMLLDAGADINRISLITPYPPLVVACTLLDSAMAHLLIDRGAGLAPGVLAHAAMGGLETGVQRLLDLGVPVDSTHDTIDAGYPFTALQCVCMRSHRAHTAAVEVLLRAGADPDVGAGGVMAPLYSCVVHDDVELARVLVAGGVHPATVCDGKTMLQLAEACGHLEMLAVLRGEQGVMDVKRW